MAVIGEGRAGTRPDRTGADSGFKYFFLIKNL